MIMIQSPEYNFFLENYALFVTQNVITSDLQDIDEMLYYVALLRKKYFTLQRKIITLQLNYVNKFKGSNREIYMLNKILKYTTAYLLYFAIFFCLFYFLGPLIYIKTTTFDAISLSIFMAAAFCYVYDFNIKPKWIFKK